MLCLLSLDPCKTRLCEHYSRCMKKADDTSECVCPVCSVKDEYSPVCASDGKTYASQCELESTSCKEKKKKSMVKRTACGEIVA